MPAQEANYARSGFVLAGRSRRFCGTLPAKFAGAIATDATSQDAAQIAALDLAANGFARPNFLRGWLGNTATRRTLVTRSDGQVTGVATARLCRDGCKIGPILAPDGPTALNLATQAAARLGQDKVIIDLPDQAGAFRKALEQAGFEDTFVTARMYRGAAPHSGPMLQAIATMELG